MKLKQFLRNRLVYAALWGITFLQMSKRDPPPCGKPRFIEHNERNVLWYFTMLFILQRSDHHK